MDVSNHSAATSTLRAEVPEHYPSPRDKQHVVYFGQQHQPLHVYVGIPGIHSPLGFMPFRSEHTHYHHISPPVTPLGQGVDIQVMERSASELSGATATSSSTAVPAGQQVPVGRQAPKVVSSTLATTPTMVTIATIVTAPTATATIAITGGNRLSRSQRRRIKRKAKLNLEKAEKLT
jgi:hypothetical protein